MYFYFYNYLYKELKTNKTKNIKNDVILINLFYSKKKKLFLFHISI